MSVNLAEQFEENEQYDKAYEEYKKAYAQRPKSIEVLERLGHVAIILDKKDEAQEYYQKILELDMSNALAYEQLMDIYVHTDRYKYYISRGNLHVIQQELSHAIGDFKKAIEKAQDQAQSNSARFVLASLYEQVGKNHSAIDEYLRILDTQGANEFVYLKLADIYLMEDALSSAIEILQRALDCGFDSDEVKENLAKLYLKNNQPDKALEFAQDDLVKIKSLLENEKNDEAFEILEKIKSLHTKNSQYFLLLAQYYFNTKNFEKSLEGVNEFNKLEPDSPLAHQMRALIFEQQGNNFDSHINWAKYNLAKKELDVALNEYLCAFQLKENDANLIKNIAELLDDMKDSTHAVEFWEKLINIEPNNKKALQRLADFNESIGDYKTQIKFLEKLYELDTKNCVVIKTLAKTYEKTKNKEKSLEFYNKFIVIAPVGEDYEQIKQKLAKLEKTEFKEEEGLIDKIMRLFINK